MERVGARERARYGLRGLRVGEALRSGPVRLSVEGVAGRKAVLSLIKSGYDSTGARLQSAPRTTPKLALVDWLARHRADLTPAFAEEVARWEPDSDDAARAPATNTLRERRLPLR